MEHLPPNVLVEIFSYLDVKDKCRITRVCKSWRKLVSAKKLWKKSSFSPHRVDLSTHWGAFRRYFTEGLHTLHLRGFIYTSDDTARCLTDAVLMDISERCPNIVELHIDEADLCGVDSGNLPPTLKELVLYRCKTIPGWFLAGVALKRLDRLMILNLKRSKNICDEDLSDLSHLTNGGNIKRLNISYCHKVTSHGFGSLAELIHLRELDVSGTNIMDQDVGVICSKLKKLTIVEFKECDFLTSESAEAFAKLKELICLFAAANPNANKIDNETELRQARIRMIRLKRFLHTIQDWIGLAVLFHCFVLIVFICMVYYYHPFNSDLAVLIVQDSALIVFNLTIIVIVYLSVCQLL